MTTTVLTAPPLYAVVLEAIWPCTQGKLRGAIEEAGSHATFAEWFTAVAHALPHAPEFAEEPAHYLCETYGVGPSDEGFCRQVGGYPRHCIAAAQLLARIAAPEIESIMNAALGISSAMTVEVPTPLQYAIMRYEGSSVHATRVLRLLTEYLPPRGAAAIHMALQILER